MRWTTEWVYADLARRSHALHRATPGDQRRRRVRATVRSVHLFRPDEDAAERHHVRHGPRSRAIAARIERIEGRWPAPSSSSADDATGRFDALVIMPSAA